MGVQISKRVLSFPLNKYPEVKLLDHVVVLSFWPFFFEEPPQQSLSVMAVPTYISKNSAVALHTFLVLVNHCYAQIILPPAILYTLNNNSPFPTPPTSVNLYSISISVNLPVLDSSYKWGINGGIIQYLPFYVWLITLKNIISVYPCCSIYQVFVPFHSRV